MFFKRLINYIKNRYHILRNDIIDALYYLNKKYIPGTLIIIKTDAIGDYILFRDFLAEVRKSSLYKNYKIVLCGNELWKDLALHYDSENVDEFIWIKPDNLTDDKYKREKESLIYKLRSEIVMYPAYSRTSEGDDLVMRSGANKKITFLGDCRNISKETKTKNDKKYNELIELEDNLSFEFYRYYEFFSKILLNDLKITKPDLISKNDTTNKIVICPGASSTTRRWSVDNFHQLSLYILNNYSSDFKFYICGSKNENELADKFCVLFPKIKYVDLTGKLSLVEFADFVSDAQLVITNDSGPLHIAAACNVNVLAISNGNNYGRFVPYPMQINNKVKTIFPLILNGVENNIERIKELQNNDSPYQINDVLIEQVINEIKIIMN
jgi:ADP-heptose:LPS heptosyltransferase